MLVLFSLFFPLALSPTSHQFHPPCSYICVRDKSWWQRQPSLSSCNLTLILRFFMTPSAADSCYKPSLVCPLISTSLLLVEVLSLQIPLASLAKLNLPFLYLLKKHCRRKTCLLFLNAAWTRKVCITLPSVWCLPDSKHYPQTNIWRRYHGRTSLLTSSGFSSGLCAFTVMFLYRSECHLPCQSPVNWMCRIKQCEIVSLQNPWKPCEEWKGLFYILWDAQLVSAALPKADFGVFMPPQSWLQNCNC